jgi:hypothetical protein
MGTDAATFTLDAASSIDRVTQFQEPLLIRE